MKELIFALYLIFPSPAGEVEEFVAELPNCENAEKIANEEFKKRDLDRAKIGPTGYICIGWKHHLARQEFKRNINTPDPVPKPQIKAPCVIPRDI